MKDEEKEGLLVIPYNYDCNGKLLSFFPDTTVIDEQQMASSTCHQALQVQLTWIT